MQDETTITVKKAIRNELRRFKAQDGLTYDEAIARLLAEEGWIDSEQEAFEEVDT
jgi:hypothetical protein